MFNETTYNRPSGGLGALRGLGVVKVRPSESYKDYKARGGTLSKEAYQLAKAQPKPPADVWSTPKPVEVPTPIPAPVTDKPQMDTGGVVPTDTSSSDGGFSLEGMLSGIPMTYLYIGGALVFYFIFIKKR